ncbi:hypothetical protein DICVIV_12419 [Dictyocaulus viviparus]|uniref:SCP domain-containing protein n=1 Tax=Dictyocaulus viviparus TaxID=29172 RepID=A0A0D8XAH6_DICVI|nr:hypothetical protein DICVIV_12419 [Dictyocaulus viviparus]
MANGRTNKVGCAYHICGNGYYDQDAKPFILFVCTYGDPQIKAGSPIYTEGPPCDSCKDRCPQIKAGSPIYTEGPPCDSCKDRCPYFNALCDTEFA